MCAVVLRSVDSAQSDALPAEHAVAAEDDRGGDRVAVESLDVGELVPSGEGGHADFGEVGQWHLRMLPHASIDGQGGGDGWRLVPRLASRPPAAPRDVVETFSICIRCACLLRDVCAMKKKKKENKSAARAR